MEGVGVATVDGALLPVVAFRLAAAAPDAGFEYRFLAQVRVRVAFGRRPLVSVAAIHVRRAAVVSIKQGQIGRASCRERV